MVHAVSCTRLGDFACMLCPESTYFLLPPSLESVIGHGNHGAMIWKCAQWGWGEDGCAQGLTVGVG